eukprot:scaffold1034_cov127-Cylindrotheca_fusiformis.AAC.12
MKGTFGGKTRKRTLRWRMTIVLIWNLVDRYANGYTWLNLSTGRRSIKIDDEQSPSRPVRCSKNNPWMRSTCHQAANENEGEHTIEPLDGDSPNLSNAMHFSRRLALQTMTVASVALIPSAATAGVPEIDFSTGSLYSPKAEMLRGGSSAARGIIVETKGRRVKRGQALQTVYDTRFIAYLARFLLAFDPSASAWWLKGDGVEKDEDRFAEFAESVEVGLADYFVGPYGSYSSIRAATAGIQASAQAKSARPDDRRGLFDSVRKQFMAPQEKKQRTRDSNRIAKQGVLNLYTLLKARYTSIDAKKQLAILFSFFSEPDLQPTAEIRSLFGEIDNATISDINLIKAHGVSEATSRSSSRRGGGYTLNSPPAVLVEDPPALGSSYKAAKVVPIMKPTSRILRIRLLDGGAGYFQAPTITVTGFCEIQCSACAILDREGHVESIVVLDPGYGYRSKGQSSPRVKIAGPRKESGSEKPRPARATLDLEYEVVGLSLKEGGNGYVLNEPPKIDISLPEVDPDWFIESAELDALQSEFGPFRAEVSAMKDEEGKLAFPVGSIRPRKRISFNEIQSNPIALLPGSVRPELNSYGSYVVPEIAAVQTFSTSPNPRFRAVDPLFGAIGMVPVTKSAAELKADEYARLAVSGAVCTVLVRTALNPLELIKTKLQLQNDEELLKFAKANMKVSRIDAPSSEEDDSNVDNASGEKKIGTVDLIKNLVALRGPQALFQSADITFLASLVFGSFGFGATELFRRSFTMAFFADDSGTSSELVLLLAAATATIITSAAASPFELLRVRSMGLVEAKPWTEVLGDFLNEKASMGDNKDPKLSSSTSEKSAAFSIKSTQPKDLLPLFAGFPPTASRELAFAIPKFLAFDIIAKAITGLINANADPGSLPIQVGVGAEGLIISAFSGAIAGIAGAFVSHPADLILTKTSASKKKGGGEGGSGADWREVVKDLLSREGGVKNLFVGLQPRLVFFFLVIGLQFFLYDYVKVLLQVGSDDLSLVLDVFYAVRQGLVEEGGIAAM